MQTRAQSHSACEHPPCLAGTFPIRALPKSVVFSTPSWFNLLLSGGSLGVSLGEAHSLDGVPASAKGAKERGPGGLSGAVQGRDWAGRWFLWFRGKKSKQVWTIALARGKARQDALCGLVSFFGFCLLPPPREDTSNSSSFELSASPPAPHTQRRNEHPGGS